MLRPDTYQLISAEQLKPGMEIVLEPLLTTAKVTKVRLTEGSIAFKAAGWGPDEYKISRDEQVAIIPQQTH